MLRINNLQLDLTENEKSLPLMAAQTLKIRESAVEKCEIVKKSVDARKKPNVKLVYSVDVQVKDEKSVLKQCKNKNVTAITSEPYVFPADGKASGSAVVVGAGPSGLFCALMLQRAGVQVTLLERGRPVEQRSVDVENFWRGGQLDTVSNVQFGEGGAGTFSDGKLTTGVGDHRLGFIIDEFIVHGAPEDIKFLAKPHIGTDKLKEVVKNIRLELIRLGADVRYESRLADIQSTAGHITGVVVEGKEGKYTLEAHHVVLATGHSARDTFEMLYENGAEMAAKNFAVGVRIEHKQSTISKAQYGDAAGHPNLPVPDYKLACHLDSGRSVFSFCVCPGGYVVASGSEEGCLVTNGMSEYLRDGENINGGLLVNITPNDFDSSHPLAGIAFQRKLEAAAFKLGGSNWFAPAQLVGDFLKGIPSVKAGLVTPTYRPGVTFTDIRKCLPEFVSESLAEAIPLLGRKLKGFDDYDTVLTAVESRSSSPVRIVRDEYYQSNIRGLYPCGEGAGFAGGIMSAAADGIRCAEKVYQDM